jgi:hypothetical protein
MNFKFLKIIIFTFFFLNSFNFSYAAQQNGINLNLTVGSCNNNGICDAGNEDFFSCPADCTPVIVPPSIPPSSGAVGGTLVMDNVFNNLTVEVSYNSAIIKWKSVIPTISNVKWGTSPDYKDGVLKNINFLLDHRVELTNLKDGTLYYFNIEAVNLLGKSNSLENQVFRTLYLPDTTPPGNPTNVVANSIQTGITISWENPKDEDLDYIHVMRSTDRYYGSPYIGHLVYEGKGNYFTDSDVKNGTKYFYTLFSRDRAGNYSSGSMVDIVYNNTSGDNWGTTLTPEEKVETATSNYVVTQGSSTYDFKMGSTISLDGGISIGLKTNYSSDIKNDDIWVEIRNSDKINTGEYFFSRIKDKDGYINVLIPPLAGGYYGVTIHRYNNNQPQIVNYGGFQVSKLITGGGYSYSWYILWFILFIFLILLLLFLLFFVILPRVFDHNS